MFEPKKFYKRARQEYIDNSLKEFGFKKYKTTCLGRLTEGQVFQFLNFQKSTYGGEQFTVNVAIRPLCSAKNDFLSLLPGNRLGTMDIGKDIWWNYSTEDTGRRNFEEVYKLIIKYALPFFEATTTSEGIISSFEKNVIGKSKFGKSVEWGTKGWIDYDFAHIYLQSGNIKKSLKHLKNCINEFKPDKRDWAQEAVIDCLKLEAIIKSGKAEIDNYLVETINFSKANLNLERW